MLVGIRQVTYLRCRLVPASHDEQNGLKGVTVISLAFPLGGRVWNIYMLVSMMFISCRHIQPLSPTAPCLARFSIQAYMLETCRSTDWPHAMCDPRQLSSRQASLCPCAEQRMKAGRPLWLSA